MKKVLVIVGFLVILISTCLCYPNAISQMRGDFYLNQWWSITESNKNWLMFFCLAISGGCIPYILWKGPKVLKKNRLEKEKRNARSN
jgi:hypothetical protein